MTDDALFEPATPRCPACLGALEPDQQFCLLCGERLQPPGPPSASPLRRRRSGVPLVAAGAALVLAGGLGIAWGFTREEARSATASTTAKSSVTGATLSTGVSIPSTASVPTNDPIPTFTAPPPDPTGTSIPDPTGTSDPTTSTSTTETTPPEETNDWPEGTDGFAVLLASKDTEQFDFAFITQQKDAAEAKGHDNAGVLNSDDYFTLNPGYWVLYLGPYDSKTAAEAVKVEVRANGYPDAYVRRVAE